MSVKVSSATDRASARWGNPSAPRPCAVYLVKAAELGLVYVGIADDFDRRWRQHRRQSWWLGEVVVEKIDVYWMTSREDARQMEAAIIHNLKPRYNTALEEAALQRYLAVADLLLDDSWPVAICEAYDGEGDLQWASA